MAEQRFVKSRGTEVPVARSQAALEKMLKRYGATGFGVSRDYERGTASVMFRVPDDTNPGAPCIPVRLTVEVGQVATAMWGPLAKGQSWRPDALAQAERVAWRQLVLWVDAALSAAGAGIQKVSEAFLAHTLVRGSDGRVMRVVEQMDEAAGGNWRALLPPGNGS